MNSLDWNDLRYVVAVARGGSAAAAAWVLRVSHATVLRRIQALEEGIGTPLFERLSSGYVPTEAGRTLTEMGASIESALTDTRRVLDGRATELAGTVRFTTTDSLAYFLLPPILASFRERYPAIKLEMLVTNTLLDLDKRDADVSLRPSAHPPESWVGMRLSRFDFGLYAAPAYLDTRRDVPWTDLDWLLPDGALAPAPASQWLRSQIKAQQGVFSVDSFVALRTLALNGMGATVLPSFMAHAEPGLALLRRAPRSASVDIWVLTHANLRQSGRVHAFMEHVAQDIRALRGHLESSDVPPE